jgi:ribosomal protein S12 methylthiotransferase accessory factor
LTLPWATRALWPSGLRPTALQGTRAQDPSLTRARLAPRLSDFGVTRVANVTGLDRIGIPVFMAIRPNSRSLSVSQGKGLTDDAAWVSATMETIELWHAEAARIDLVHASEAEISARGRFVRAEGRPMRPGSPYSRDHRILWTRGRELFSGDVTYVPYALVHVDSVPPFPPGDECFFVTSNGLASGSVLPEALVHALCEVIERDSVTRWRRAAGSTSERQWVDLDTVSGADALRVLSLCETARIDVLACDVTSRTGLPTFLCVLLDREESSDTLRGAAMGFGCHLRREIAFLRALTEAAQSRLTLIAGSRDDLDRQDYEARRRHRDGIEGYRRILGASHGADFASVPDHPATTFTEQVATLLARLTTAGIDEVVLVDLTLPGSEIAVVRVVVPGLVGPDHAH